MESSPSRAAGWRAARTLRRWMARLVAAWSGGMPASVALYCARARAAGKLVAETHQQAPPPERERPLEAFDETHGVLFQKFFII